jgi:hypothetical protein
VLHRRVGIGGCRTGLECGCGFDEPVVAEWLQLGASSTSAVTRVAVRVIIVVERALTALSRAILISRIASTCPSADLGTGMSMLARTWRAACSASMTSLLPDIRRSPRRGGRATSRTV